MVSSNKILTVSYGTFSCTLEGFDNSFDTMKAIAEYFRDLAQDDRYFGAEPPTPDAEMLARIAEREIARRVEARFEKGNLVLRPSDDAEPPRGDVAPLSSRDAALGDATAGAAATALAVATQSAAAEGSAPDEGLDTPDTTALQAADVSEMSESDTDALDLTEVDLSGISIDTGDDDTDVLSAEDVLDGPSEDDAEGSIEDLIAAQDNAVLAEVETPEPEAAPVVTDSVAEKLQRIRAVVASKSQAAPEYIEDQHAMAGSDVLDDSDDEDAEEAVSLDDNLFTDTIAALVSDQIEDEDEDDSFLPETAYADEDDAVAAAATATADPQSELEALRAKIAELEAQAAATRAAEEAVTTQPAEEDLAALHLDDDEDDADDTLEFDDEDDEDDDTLELDDEDEDEDTLSFDDADEDETADIDALTETDSDEDDDIAPFVLKNAVADEDDDEDDTVGQRQPLIARVGKARRADVEAALAAGRLEEYEDEDEDDVAPAAIARPIPGMEDSSLTPEQEAELARELADLHAEIDNDDDWDFDDEDDDDTHELTEAEAEAASANIRKAVKLTSPARAMLTDTSIEEDTESVERLADKTDTEMEEPEGNRRRSAIAHLRAAVAATKADRILGFSKKTVDEEEPYREDLADAVRPRRPKISETRSARPAPVRPAPLKLVAEQRIDVDSAADTAPVRPRRVVRNVEPVDAAEAVASDDRGFAEFAENQGAHTLPELLEAAAAYMSFVEGRDQFSRPQLMTKLLQAEGEASSREERLRSFGQLLREGKIEKKGGGRFAASDSIGFKPDARAAG
ncbi:MAG: hypothetical protein MRY75_14575 [Marivita sp.]|uniref:hypothetical protein n=1 Tax=Marivita sp. TaxID=2003365 RepID=UPI0025BCA323|nr:hypothetical protein [Marivita sp.]MCI5111770.1 hypothetical protein [Marivita sp.]